MAKDKGQEEENTGFTSDGDGLLTLGDAGMLAIRIATDSPGDYGRGFRETTMVFEVVEAVEDGDYYNIVLSIRPQGNFVGWRGEEQFSIRNNGSIANRQVLSLPVKKRSGFPAIPVVIALAAVGAVAAIGVVFALGSSGDKTPITVIAPAPTSTPYPTPTPRPTYTPPPTPTVTVRVLVVTPTFTPKPIPTRTPRPTPTLSANFYFDKGWEYGDDEDWEMAIREYTMAIEVNPNYARAYFGRAYSYHERGTYQNAIDDYTKAIQLDPDFALAYNSRGNRYRAIGQPTLADADKTMACYLDSQYCSNNVVTPTPTPYPTPSMTQDCDYTLLIDQGFSSFAGKTIQFKIGSSWANETTVWVQGGAELLDLTSSTAMIPFGPYRAWPISLTVPSTRTTFLSQRAPPYLVLGTANATPGTPITAWIDGNQVATANCS